MKRGGFWATTVATGLLVAGLMTVGRAGLRSQGWLYLQGQMKIAAGDTDSGLKLLAAATTEPKVSTESSNPQEAATRPVAPEGPCHGSIAPPKQNRVIEKAQKVRAAPEPTLASLVVPSLPGPAVIPATYMQDAIPYIATAQREALRVQQAELHRAQRIREQEVRRALRHASFQFESKDLPDPVKIQTQVQKELGSWVQ